SMLNAQALILLTNVDGIFRGNPEEGNAELIEEVHDPSMVFSSFVSARRSQFGRGGMITKSGIARRAAGLGIAVHIANGTTDDVLPRILENDIKHTRFIPRKSASGKKKWIAHAGHNAKGTVLVNEGARAALVSDRASSLLPVGIISIEDDFQKGEGIRILDHERRFVGLGIAGDSSD